MITIYGQIIYFLKTKLKCIAAQMEPHEVALHTVQGEHKLAGDDLSNVMSKRQIEIPEKQT